MCSVTAQGHPRTRFHRAIERRALHLAEESMREMGGVTLGETLKLVEFYRDLSHPKYDKAARSVYSRT